MTRNCSVINAVEELEIYSGIQQHLKNNKALEAKEIVQSFISDVLTPYLANKYGVQMTSTELLTEEELDFMFPVLNAAVSDRLPYAADKQQRTKLVEVQQAFNDAFNAGEINAALKPLVDQIKAKEEAQPEIQPVRREIAEIMTQSQIDPSAIAINEASNASSINALFNGADTAKLIMEKEFKSNIIRSFFTNQSKGVFNITNKEVDSSIKNYKNSLYKDLRSYFAQDLKGTYPDSLYDEDGDKNMTDTFEDFKTEILNILSSKNLTNSHLEMWAISEDDNVKEQAVIYGKYNILANFDSFVMYYANGAFNISDSYSNDSVENYEKVKYSIVKKNNAVFSNLFSNQELFKLADEQSPIFKMIMDSTPLLSKEGKFIRGKAIKQNDINSLVAKVFEDLRRDNQRQENDKNVFDKTDPLNSTKAIFETYIKRQFNMDPRGPIDTVTDMENAILLSLYVYYFKDNNTLEQFVPKAIANQIIQNGISSLYELQRATEKEHAVTNFSLYSIAVANFSKTHFYRYIEYAYDPDSKTLRVNSPNAQYNKGYQAKLSNNMYWAANQKNVKERYNQIMEGVTIGENEVTLVTLPAMDGTIDIKVNLGEAKVYIGELELSDAVPNDAFTGGAYNAVTVDVILKVVEQVSQGSLRFSSNPELWQATLAENKGRIASAIRPLIRMASYFAYVKYLNTLTKEEVLKEKFLVGRNYSDLYQVSGEKEGYELASFYPAFTQDINEVARAVAHVAGAARKSQVFLKDGTSMPQLGEISHLQSTHTWMQYIKKYCADHKIKTPLHDNFFYNNPHMIENPYVRANVNVGDNVKSSGDLTANEVIYTMIAHDFYDAIGTLDKALIQTTVFTDKNAHRITPVNMSKDLQVDLITSKTTGRGKAFSVTHEKVLLKDQTPERLHEAVFLSNKSYYDKLTKYLWETYKPVFQKLSTKYPEVATILTSKPTNSETRTQLINKAMAYVSERDFREAYDEVHNQGTDGLIQNLGITVFTDSEGKKTIGLSDTLTYYSKIFAGDSYKSPAFEGFIKRKRADFIKGLKDVDLKISYVDEQDEILPLFKDSLSKMKDMEGLLPVIKQNWLDERGYLIIEKDGVLNPLFEKFFAFSNFITDAAQNLNMATIHNHPVKGVKGERGTTNYYEEAESAALKAYFKRMVHGTPGKPFLLNTISGVPAEIKTVYVEDIMGNIHNLMGEEAKANYTDGASFITVAQAILQNNSLVDNAVGLTQKTLGFTIDPKTGSLGLQKNAEFALTNEYVRRSKYSNYNLLALVEKSYNIPLTLTAKNDPTRVKVLDISRDFNGNEIKMEDIAPDGAYYRAENGDIIQVISLRKINDVYQIETVNLTKKARKPVSTPIVLNTAYDLWQAFGGLRSVSRVKDGVFRDSNFEEYAYSDGSHYILTEYMNRVGEKITDVNKKTLAGFIEKVDLDNYEVFKPTDLATQKNVWQPLKLGHIPKYVLDQAQKSGTLSQQKADKVFDRSDLKKGMIYSKSPALSIFVLLNSDHETEGSTVTEMSQIVSILAANASVLHDADQAYRGLAKLVNVEIANILDGIEEFKLSDGKVKDKLYQEVSSYLLGMFEQKEQIGMAGLILEAMKKGIPSSSIAPGNIVELEAEELRAQEEGSDQPLLLNRQITVGNVKMPFSSYIYGQFISLFSNHINATAIKRQHSGGGMVIKPGGELVKMHEVPIFQKEENGDLSLDDNGDPIIIGTRVIDSDEYDELGGEASNYRQPIAPIEMSITDHVELIDLNDPTSVPMSVYINSPAELNRLKGLVALKPSLTVYRIYGKARPLKKPETKFYVEGYKLGGVSIHELPIYSIGESLHALMDGNVPSNPEGLFAFLSSRVEGLTREQLFDPKNNYLKDNYYLLNQHVKNHLQDIINKAVYEKEIIIDGVTYKVTNVKTIPGEVLAPSVHRREFGLPVGININDITLDTFREILVKRSTPELKDSKYFIRDLNGNHTYVYTRKQVTSKGFSKVFNNKTITTAQIDGDTWVVNKYGDKLYRLPGEEVEMKTMLVNGKQVNILIIPDLETNDEQRLLNSFIDYNSKIALRDEVKEYVLEELPSFRRPILTKDFDSAKTKQKDEKTAQEMYSSFQLSLDFDSARIPAETEHSHSASRIIGFIHTEANTFITNTFSSVMKGEDYDIDKSYLLGSTIKNGIFQGWHKMFDISTEQKARLSVKLPLADEARRIFEDPTIAATDKFLLVLSPEEVAALISEDLTDQKVNTLIKLSRDFRYTALNLDETTKTALVDAVNDYFTYSIPNEQLSTSIKNLVARTLFRISAHAINQVHSETLTSVDEQKRAAKGKDSIRMSAFNPMSFAYTQRANMVGRDAIGITASTGLKAWYALTYWANTHMHNNPGNLSRIAVNKEFVINGVKYVIPFQANLNFTSNVKTEVTPELAALRHPEISDPVLALSITKAEESNKFLTNFEEYIAKSIAEPQDRAQVMAMFNLNINQSVVQGGLMASATDNAKELILDKINADPNTLGMYLAMSTMGIPFMEAAKFMTSVEAKWLTKHSHTNIYNPEYQYAQVASAITLASEGPNIHRYSFGRHQSSAYEWFKKAILDYAYSQPNSLPNRKELEVNFNPTLSGMKKAGLTDIVGILRAVRELAKKTTTLEINISIKSQEDLENLQDRMDNGDFIEHETPNLRQSLVKFTTDFLEVAEETENMSDEVIQTFKHIYDASNELSMLGTILGINQGIKTNSYDQYNTFARVDDYLNKRVYVYMHADEKNASVLQAIMRKYPNIPANELYSLSFEKFLRDPEYAEMIKEIYAEIKDLYNIFDVIATSPHFTAMLKAAVAMEDTKSILTVKYRTMKKVLKELVEDEIIVPKDGSVKLDDKNYNKVLEFVNESIIRRWIRKLEDKRFITNKGTNIVYKLEDMKFKKIETETPCDVNIDLATMEGRKNFIHMFGEMVTNLQMGKLSNTDTNVNQSLLSNEFVQNLRAEYRKDPMTGLHKQFFALPLDMTKIEENKVEFNKILLGFRNLGNMTYNGMLIKDVVFLYNMLINKDKISKDALTKLFEYDSNYADSSLILSYIKEVSNLDSANEALQELRTAYNGDPDYSIFDSIFNLLAVRVYESDIQKNKNRGRFVYTKTFDRDNLKLVTTFYEMKDGKYVEWSNFGDPNILPSRVGTSLGDTALKDAIQVSLTKIKSLLGFLGNRNININIKC